MNTYLYLIKIKALPSDRAFYIYALSVGRTKITPYVSSYIKKLVPQCYFGKRFLFLPIFFVFVPVYPLGTNPWGEGGIRILYFDISISFLTNIAEKGKIYS